MPAWLVALIAQLPQLIAEIEAIVQAGSKASLSQGQLDKLSAYSAAVNAINGLVSYHAAQ
jgi:hypothetical protein